jgi:glycine cleavage system P protein (glycine dehydrogenase)
VVDLLREEAFVDRHVGPRTDDVERMLATLGVASLDELVDQAVPASIRDDKPLDVEAAASETLVLRRLQALADRNQVATSLIGQGYYGTHVPGVILRNVMESPAWYTAYTPYQPEISQGRLEALLNFQTMVCDLVGLDIANASMLDESTAAAEAMTLARRATRHAGTRFFVDAECHPQTIEVVRTRAEALGIEVDVGDPRAHADTISPDDHFAVLLQHPGTSGVVRDLRPVIDHVHASGALAVVATDLLACCLLTPPGELGADVAVGSSQRFGVPMGFGGPHAGFLATRDVHKRSLPGRLVGVSVDAAGRPAYRLALQTREQHIRREKATSNICTAQVLLAVMAAMYAVYHGPDGLRRIATRVQALTSELAARLETGGYELANDSWFDTLTVRAPGRAAELHRLAVAQGINLRPVDDDTVGLSLDETTDSRVLARLLAVFGLDPTATCRSGCDGIPGVEQRTSDFLTHPVFHSYHSETEMLRYLRRLADRDVALDRAMIPLGSCTMKLNATTEMEPVTWPGFAHLHPFAPLDQAEGYRELIHDLEATLAELTGYDAVSLQPNAGSQGELAGLLAIAKYHQSRGDDQRDVCLIPSSAHGTNAASAVMAGLRVVVVACDDDGNVDLADLRAKADEHGERLAALMVTYPSTHGVFEVGISEICDVVHDHGGQVYIDGANLNALVGVARPGWFGGDVSHLNLHKTFCIPHGGGGPGVGPVAARAHLAPFLPNHPLAPEAGPATGPGPISGAPWGSAGILPISWAYTKLMGPDGLRRATEVAILNANYVAARLAEHYPILYVGENGRVAHECIVDLRPLAKATGVSVDDVAKRLVDYGFHAPTMSFPVAGTLMIEPTESESLAELDRFCDAMVAIRSEIARVESGEWPVDDSPLRHAPHTVEDLLTADWTHPYSREDAAYPVKALRRDRYWPPVNRIDGGYGDRNLVCACPPPDAFE